MPPNSTSLRYFAAKLHAAVTELLVGITSGPKPSSMASILERALEVYNNPLTSLVVYNGKAMAPTLNPTAASSTAAGAAEAASSEKLLVRWLRRPSARNVFPNDVRLLVVGVHHTTTTNNNNTGGCVSVTNYYKGG